MTYSSQLCPVFYLLMKRHYEIMRAMRTKVLDSRELGSGVESFINVKDAIQYRVNDLTSTSSLISLARSVSLTWSQASFPIKNLTPRRSSRISLMELWVITCPFSSGFSLKRP
jgi:hypothetical protein